MRILAVDTSSARGSVCAAENGEVAGEIRLASSVQHSERLFAAIEFLLNYLPFDLADVDLFVAARGPGSFTGLRVGLAAMNGFAAACQRPAAGVSTLEALAWKTGLENCTIASVIDAGRGEIYGALYRRTEGLLVEMRRPQALRPAEWFASLPEEPLYFCGDGAVRYREYIDRPAWSLYRMDLFLGGAIAELALTPNSGPLEPLYVRRTDAEIAREKQHEGLASPNTKS